MTPKTARALVPLACSFVLLVAVACVTAMLVAQQARDSRATSIAMQARGNLLELFSALQDAETGQRGFLLEGRPSYLTPFLDAEGRMDTLFRSLDATYADDPAGQRRLLDLRTVVDAKMAELRKTIELKKQGDDRGALHLVGSDAGLHLMQQARAIVGELREGNVRRMSERQELARRAGQFVEISVILAIIAAMGSAAFVLNDARRREARLRTAVDDREAAFAELAAAAARRDRLEEQLRQSQKMEAVGQLTGGLAHDFNNMLAIIIGSLAMMKRRMQRGEGNLAGYVEMAMEGAERAANLTHRLLAFARRQPLAPEIVQLNKVLPGLSELLRRTLGEMVQVETVLAGGLWLTRVDANQLENAILNLAVNARDAMPDGGRLTLETANAHLDEAYAAEHVEVNAGQYVMVAVTDTGAGMDAATVARAFDPFFTTKGVGKGTGLGPQPGLRLHQAVRAVTRRSTRSQAAERPSGCILPRSFEVGESAYPGPGAPSLTSPWANPGSIILVVEDEEGVRRLTVDALRDLNYTVIHASSGVDALKIFEESDQHISLLLTDVVMPQLTGKQLVDRARAIRPDLKTLFMTGYTRNSIVHNGVIDPGVQLISKPFTLEQLARKVRECVEGTS